MEKTRIGNSTTLFVKHDRSAASCTSSTHGTTQLELYILSSVLTDQIPRIPLHIPPMILGRCLPQRISEWQTVPDNGCRPYFGSKVNAPFSKK
uniref:Uncharacterized protein n=1 Tax=Parascaris equorum TaxID=6256 RepID=A0A914R7S5_PAREQ